MGTTLVVLLTPISVLVFVLILSESNPYCDGGEDRIRCAMRLVGVTRMSILPAAVIDLFLVAAAIGVWRNFRSVARRPACRTLAALKRPTEIVEKVNREIGD